MAGDIGAIGAVQGDDYRSKKDITDPTAGAYMAEKPKPLFNESERHVNLSNVSVFC